MPEPADSTTAPGAPQTLPHLRHDLCNRLNQILGYSELLLETGEPTAQVAADLRKIHEAALAMLELVRARLTSDLLAADVLGEVADQGPEPIVSPFEHPSAHSARALPPGRILVVDDDPLNLELLAQRLTRDGHLVSAAADGVLALELIRKQPFDLVLLDVVMPRLDGFATLSALKGDERHRSIPVIMISALNEFSSVVRCIEAGAEDYLTKPFNATLLRARVGSCLEKKRSHDQQRALYDQLLLSQQQLDRSLIEASQRMAALAPELRVDSRVAPVLEAFARMAGAVSQRETDLRSSLSELKIEFNRSHLGTQVTTIVADPSFSSLSERAKAMRARRRGPSSAP